MSTAMSKHKQKDNFRDLTIEERNKIKNRTEEEARIS
jgi:hypothetical protein